MDAAQIGVASTALEAKLRAITEIAEEFNERKNRPGTVACMMTVLNPIGLGNFPKNQRQADSTNNDPHRNAAIDAANARLQNIWDRMDQIHPNETVQEPPQPSNEEINVIQVAAMAINALSDSQALMALARMTADRTTGTTRRWMAYAIACAIDDEFGVPERMEAIRNRDDWPTMAGTGDILLTHIRHYHAQNGSWRETLNRAATELCQEHDINEISYRMLQKPGVILETIKKRDPELRYQLTMDIMPGQDESVDGLVFRYRDTVYMKTIGEPFPKGFPASTAAEIAEQYLERYNSPHRGTQETAWDYYKTTALSVLRIAHMQLHCVSPEDLLSLMDTVSANLPRDTDMPRHILRIVTGRNDSVQDLMLLGHMDTPPVTTRNGAARIIRAARRAGLNETDIWELGRFLKTDPDQHGIRRPAADGQALKHISDTARKAGIPDAIIAMIREETGGHHSLHSYS